MGVAWNRVYKKESGMKYAYVALVALGLLVGERSDAVGVGVVRSYGVKLGVVSAGQSWDYSGGMSGLKVFDKRISGLAVGGYVEWLAIPTISLVTEVDYAQKGCRDAVNVLSEGSPVPTGTMTIRPRLDYVSIPVLLKLRYGLSFGSVYGLAGPRYDILVGKRGDSRVAEVFDHVKSADYGITLGVGIELASLLTKRLGAEFRYSPNFRKIFTSELLAVKNNSFEFMAVVGF